MTVEEIAQYSYIPVAIIHEYESRMSAVGALLVLVTHVLSLRDPPKKCDLRYHELWIATLSIKVRFDSLNRNLHCSAAYGEWSLLNLNSAGGSISRISIDFQVIYYVCAVAYDARDPTREMMLLLRDLLYLSLEATSHLISIVFLRARYRK